MKKILLSFASIYMLTAVVSCSKSSGETVVAGEDNSVPTTYFPLKIANYWDYDVQNRASTSNPASSATDHLFVDSDITVNGVLFKKMATTTAPNGFFASVLKDNKLRIDGTRLRATGTLSNTFISNVPFNVNFDDFIILKDNAGAGTQLSTTSGVVNQTISGYPTTFNYTMTSYADGTLATFTSNGVNYTNVKKTKLVLNLTATVTSSGLSLVALPAQDVIISTLHFVSGKGMIYDNRLSNYQLNAGVAAQLGVPASSSQLQEEYLTGLDVSH